MMLAYVATNLFASLTTHFTYILTFAIAQMYYLFKQIIIRCVVVRWYVSYKVF